MTWTIRDRANSILESGHIVVCDVLELILFIRKLHSMSSYMIPHEWCGLECKIILQRIENRMRMDEIRTSFVSQYIKTNVLTEMSLSESERLIETFQDCLLILINDIKNEINNRRKRSKKSIEKTIERMKSKRYDI